MLLKDYRIIYIQISFTADYDNRQSSLSCITIQKSYWMLGINLYLKCGISVSIKWMGDL